MKQQTQGWNGFLRGAAVFLCILATACGRQELDTLRFEDEQVLYAQTYRIEGFDPATSSSVSTALAMGKIYEGLLQYSYLTRPYQVEPLLAESMPEVSEDGLTYTFKIREDVFFQDDPCFPDGKGRQLVAEDFVYAIKRVADAKLASSGYWAFNGRIVGLDAFREMSSEPEPTDYDADVEGLRALDDRTLQIQLTGPYPQLLWILAMHYSFAVPREAVELYADDFVNHPVGTGPFILNKWTRNYRLEFFRSPKWAEVGRVELYPSEGTDADRAAGRLNDAGKQLPFLDRIVQYVVDDPATQWMMFLSGHFSVSGISRDNWDVVITPSKGLVNDLEKQKVDLISTPTMELRYIGFNMDDPVVGKNKKLRQALSCAYDPQVMVTYYNDRVAPIYGPVPEPLAGFKPETTAYSYNPEKAKQLLAEAGYPDGIDPETGRRLELTIEIGSAGSDVRQSIDLLIDMFDQAGIVLNASYNNWPAFLEKMDRRQAQLFTLGWVADYPDPENFLQLFYSDNVSPGPNHANYMNPAFDSLYDQVRTLLPGEKKDRLCGEMADIVIEDCPWIFMYQPMSYALVHNWLNNYKAHSFPYGMTKYRRVDNRDWNEWKAENK